MARVLWLALLVLAALSAASVRAQDEGASLDTYGPWINGRATYYGGPTENWSVQMRMQQGAEAGTEQHGSVRLDVQCPRRVLLNGGCNYGYIDPREPLGYVHRIHSSAAEPGAAQGSPGQTMTAVRDQFKCMCSQGHTSPCAHTCAVALCSCCL